MFGSGACCFFDFFFGDFVELSSPSFASSASSPSLAIDSSPSPFFPTAFLPLPFFSGFPKKPSRTKGASGFLGSSSFSTSASFFFLSSFLGGGGGEEPDGGGATADGAGDLSEDEGGVVAGGREGAASPPVEGGEIDGSPGKGGVCDVLPSIDPPGRDPIDRRKDDEVADGIR